AVACVEGERWAAVHSGRRDVAHRHDAAFGHAARRDATASEAVQGSAATLERGATHEPYARGHGQADLESTGFGEGQRVVTRGTALAQRVAQAERAWGGAEQRVALAVQGLSAKP